MGDSRLADEMIEAAKRAAAEVVGTTYQPSTGEWHYEGDRKIEAAVAAVVPLLRARIADEIDATWQRQLSRRLHNPSDYMEGRHHGFFAAARIARGSAAATEETR